MSINHATVTAASRIMLPVDVAFSIATGLIWALQDTARTNRSLSALAQHWPVPNTGMTMIGIGALIGIGLLTHTRWLTAVGLGAGTFGYFLVGLIFISPLDLTWSWGDWPFLGVGNPTASLSAPAWPWYLCAAHLASLVSIGLEEFTDTTGERHPRHQAAQ